MDRTRSWEKWASENVDRERLPGKTNPARPRTKRNDERYYWWGRIWEN